MPRGDAAADQPVRARVAMRVGDAAEQQDVFYTCTANEKLYIDGTGKARA